MNDPQVIIAGAGPVGATLAIDLARRGIRTLILERSTTPRRLPKMERCNARTMELFRRYGLVETIRKASRYTPMPMDIFVMASFHRPPLLHLRYPSVPEAYAQVAVCQDGTLPLEPAQLISQYTLEPILRDAAVAAGADIRYGVEVTGCDQDAAGVTVHVRNGASMRAAYLVGCDGGVSTVRKHLGIPLSGQGRMKLIHQVFFRSEHLFDRIPTGRGRHYYFPEGSIVVQDDLRHFMTNFHDWVPGHDTMTRLRQMIDLDVDIEILSEADWQHHLLVADRYREGRVLIAGDAAHLVIPQGALGMNTGIGDVVDLGWKLAATLQGWGGPALLASYEAERREIGLRNRDTSGTASRGVGTWRAAVKAWFREDSAQGEANRAEVAALAAAGQPIGHELHGTEFGYRYTRSPVLVPEDNVRESGMREYIPTAASGARLPHLWRVDGSSVHDALGDRYTVIRLGSNPPEASALVSALQETGAPAAQVTMPEPHLRERYERALVLVRPDFHVAWRGDGLPDDLPALARRVTGHS